MVDTRKISVGLVQMAMSNDIEKNFTRVKELVGKAAGLGAKIICLPELFATQYFAQIENKDNFSLAEVIPGKTSLFLCELAKELKVVIVGGSIFEKGEEGKYYNTCLVVNEVGEIVSKYRKIHIPQDQYYFEQFYFTSGNLGYTQVDVNGVKIAPMICYDQWFPEAARVNVLNGAEMLFYPTAIGWFDEMKQYEPTSSKRWEDAMRSHASLNGVYTVAVNRVGKEDNLTFWGGSFIADTNGEMIVQCSKTQEEVLVINLDLNEVTRSQESWGFLKNRKPATYNDLVKDNLVKDSEDNLQ